MTLFAHSLSFDEVKDFLREYSEKEIKIKSAEITSRAGDGKYDLLIVFEQK